MWHGSGKAFFRGDGTVFLFDKLIVTALNVVREYVSPPKAKGEETNRVTWRYSSVSTVLPAEIVITRFAIAFTSRFQCARWISNNSRSVFCENGRTHTQKMTGMHLIYGHAYGNRTEARRLYHQRFLQRQLPHRQTFVNIDCRQWESGTIQLVTANLGRPLSVQTPNLEDTLHTQQDPSSSTRRIASVEHVSHMTVWRVFCRQLL
jgi:hypothetical protein